MIMLRCRAGGNSEILSSPSDPVRPAARGTGSQGDRQPGGPAARGTGSQGDRQPGGPKTMCYIRVLLLVALLAFAPLAFSQGSRGRGGHSSPRISRGS
jgi:hypothetical protein